MHHQDPLYHQDAAQNRERNKLLLRKLNQTRERERGKEREQERERLHQLQSINNLLLDITPPSSSYLQDLSSSSQSDKNVSIDGRWTFLVNVSQPLSRDFASRFGSCSNWLSRFSWPSLFGHPGMLILCFLLSVSGESAISDMFGLGLPRGSLMGNQSTVGSSNYRNYQYGSFSQAQGSSSQQQHEVRSCESLEIRRENLAEFDRRCAFD